MKNTIFLFIIIFISNAVRANEKFEFTKDIIKSFTNLNEATLDYYKTLENPKSQEKLKTETMNFVALLVESQNLLLPYLKSESDDVKKVANDLRNLMSDLVKENYSFLGSVSNPELKSNELLTKSEAFKNKLSFVSSFFNQITLGSCMILARERIGEEKNNADKQYSVLTLEQRDELNKLLIDGFGNSVKEGQKMKSETAFESSARIMYEFLNMEWEFKKNVG